MAKVPPGANDDEVVNIAMKNGYVVVSPDRKLLSRCRMLGIQVVNVDFETLAKLVHELLKKAFKVRP